MKKDPYKHKERWQEWKENAFRKGIEGISKANSDIILQFLKDMELGLNISKKSCKGGRAPNRLNDLKGKLIFFSKKFEQRFKITDLTQITEEQLFTLLNEMKTGIIKRENGGTYQGVSTFARDFKAFWNWYVKISKKNNLTIPCIVEDLSSRPPSNSKFVYLTEDQIKKLANSVNFNYKALILFLYDTGLRAPTETCNIKVSDFSSDCKELNIRDEIVKRGSFGRTIQLRKCSEILNEYIKTKNLHPNDFLFNINSASANKYLQRYSKKLFGSGMTKGGESYNKLSLYDFRHCACCFWIQVYKKDRQIMHRFGWKNSDKIYYYSRFVGMSDVIEDEDLITGADKTNLEKRLKKTEEENQYLKEKLETMEKSLKNVDQLVELVKQKALAIEK